MGQISSLADVVFECEKDLRRVIGENITDIILYGSYSYQDLKKPADEFDSLHEKNGLLDRKPDLVVIVNDLESAVNSLSEAYGWSEKSRQKVLKLRRDAAYYFNISTTEEHDFDLGNITAKAKIPMKIALISEQAVSHMEKTMAWHNIYLPSRLSKPVNILSTKNKEELKDNIEKIQEYFIELTLKTLPKVFYGEQFMKRYIQITYLATVYRVFDFVRPKHRKIMQGHFYDLAEEELITMREQLEKTLGEKLYNNRLVEVHKKNNSVYESVFLNKSTKHLKTKLYDFPAFNLKSFSTVIGVNRITNKAGGGSGAGYLIRKIARMLNI